MSILGSAKRPEVQAPVKGWFYGAPDAGKTHLAKQFPKPLLLSTDGNYIYETIPANSLNTWEVGPLAKPEEKGSAFINVLNMLKKSDTYQTVILDLVDGAFRLVRDYYLRELKIQHESDLGYGKAYTTVRENFISAIEQLFKLPMNVIIISHEDKDTVKPRNKAEYDVFKPMLNDKFHETFEGYCNLVARIYKDTDSEGKDVRMLTLSPTDTAFGINRLGSADDLVLVHNGDNYGDFYKVWSELYQNRKLGFVPDSATNATRKMVEKDKAETKKADEKDRVARVLKKKEPVVEAPAEPVVVPVVEEKATTTTAKETQAEKLARMRANRSEKNAPVAEEKVEVVETPVSKAVEPIEDTQDDEPEMTLTDEAKLKLAKIAKLKANKKLKDKK